MRKTSIIRLIRARHKTDRNCITKESTSLHRLKVCLLTGLFLLLAIINPLSQVQSAKQDESLAVERPDTNRFYYRVTIAEPFIEMHTGPSAGYPIFHVVDLGDEVSILHRKTNWFKVETSDGKTGWVSRDQMRRTLQPSGEPF